MSITKKQPLSIDARFDQKVLMADGDACWEWQGSLNTDGYGVFCPSGQEKIGAHRYAWMREHGPIPDGMCVCHHCDNRRCVRPDHLWLGTVADNTRDMVNKGRAVYPKGEAHGCAVLSEEDVARIRMAPGLLKDIASEFGIHVSTLSRIKRGERWHHSSDVVTHSHGKRKLTDEQVGEIRSTAGVSQYALARQYGVTQALISLIKRSNYRQPKC